MTPRVGGILLLLLVATQAAAGPGGGTFSIIGFDPEPQELGVAVQSRAF
ncbi:MAG: hypothetical protein GF346_06270, partial [Candidatus Eisenbacteria bacterium]|nr:hypothetical protein [Candidatus Latescibacterota bacterium]MBD3302031.1 hypothetical protein [Candidatus Eisenbacteria bacterium]